MPEPTRATARTETEIVEAVARFEWWEVHQEECPVQRIPPLGALALWLPKCPKDAVVEAHALLTVLFGEPAWWTRCFRFAETDLFACCMEKAPSKLSLTIDPEDFYPMHINEVHNKWRRTEASKRPKHPLAPLVAAWQHRPTPATANLRSDPVLPSKLAMIEPASGQLSNLFASAAHFQERTDRQLVLPGFGVEKVRGPALPLKLYDLGGGPSIERGRGAPLALRLFIEAILSVPLGDRDRPVAMSVPLRELLSWLYPGQRQPRPNEYWPRLNAAVEDLDRPEARIPWYDPDTNRGGARRVVSATDIPRGPGALDDLVTMTVHLPPGSDQGPVIDRMRLRWWGVRRGPAYRAMIGLAYRWFQPGVTRVPAKKDKRYWMQAQSPERYGAPITDEELISLFYPTATRKQRRNLLSDAKKVLHAMIETGDVRLLRGRLLPPPPRGK